MKLQTSYSIQSDHAGVSAAILSQFTSLPYLHVTTTFYKFLNYLSIRRDLTIKNLLKERSKCTR